MQAVVSDTSPLIYLTRLGLFSPLRTLYDRVIVPAAVWQEITVGGKGLPESENLQLAVTQGWIECKAPSSSQTILPSSSRLGQGEIEAILLATELRAVLLNGDSDARATAEHLGVTVSETLGILSRAKREGHLTNLKSLLDRLLAETNFHMGEALYRKVLEGVGEHPSQP